MGSSIGTTTIGTWGLDVRCFAMRAPGTTPLSTTQNVVRCARQGRSTQTSSSLTRTGNVFSGSVAGKSMTSPVRTSNDA